MTWKDGLFSALLRFVQERREDAVAIIDFDEEIGFGGYCDTCSYETVEVFVHYKDTEGKTRAFAYRGSFAELIAELTD